MRSEAPKRKPGADFCRALPGEVGGRLDLASTFGAESLSVPLMSAELA